MDSQNETDPTRTACSPSPASTGSAYVELRIRFPSREAMMGFAAWMCDGGGEQDYFDSMDMHYPEHAIGRMAYHREDDRYSGDDKRRYGPFMADNLIIAHKIITT